MAKLVKASITDVSRAQGDPSRTIITVLFNPTDLSMDRASHYASMPVPGLSMPILQYIRGESDVLTLELFLDRTDQGSDVDADIKKLSTFCRIDGVLHAPPVMEFSWANFVFTGVVTSFRQRMTLFSEDGRTLRARITLSLKSYKSAQVQLRELKLQSPDRTHVRILREGETLAHIANEAYGDPRLWRPIALANDIERPGFVPVGTPLTVPSL
jgi:hypothetical protein